MLNNQKGSIHLFFLLLLILSIGIGVFLVVNRTTFFSKASEENIKFVDTNGNLIRVTDSLTVNIQVGDVNFQANSSLVNQVNAQESTTYRIAGKIYIDSNKNQTREADERFYPDGSTIVLSELSSNREISRTVSNNEGNYEFSNLTKGNYRITITLPNGFEKSSDNSVGIENLDRNLEIDFGIVNLAAPIDNSTQKYRIVGKVFNDLNQNGQRDGSDTFLSGVTIKLIDLNLGKEIDSRLSNSEGNYEFINLARGDYRVNLIIPSGYVRSTDDSTPVRSLSQDIELDFGVKDANKSIKIVFSEDPNFQTNKVEYDYIKDKIYQYTFTSNSPGRKVLYAKFESAAGKSLQAKPFPAIIEYFPRKKGIHTVKVLSISFIPPDSTNSKLDVNLTGENILIEEKRQYIASLNHQAGEKLTEASRFHGYKDANAEAYLTYQIVDHIENLSPIPGSNNKPYPSANTYRPDYRGILEKVNICNYVDKLGVSQVWLWGYHFGGIEPVESNMSMGKKSSSYWNKNAYGDISNSEGTDDMPICESTYTLYNYNYNRGLGEILEDHGHHIEALFKYLDPNLYDLFVNPHGEDRSQVNRCGWTHSPPNVNKGTEYVWDSDKVVYSDCEDWRPRGIGKVSEVSCRNWFKRDCSPSKNENSSAGSVLFKVWWMQNLPGYNSGLMLEGKPLRNIWDFYKDLDKALSEGAYLATPFILNSRPAYGLKGEYFNDNNLRILKAIRYDERIDFSWGLGSPMHILPVDNFSIRWSGKIKPRYTDTYRFYATGDDAVRLIINGSKIIDNWDSPTAGEVIGDINLDAGKEYDIVMEYKDGVLAALVKLEWSSRSQRREIIPSSQLKPAE